MGPWGLLVVAALMVGLLLLVIEILVIPGFGVIGGLGIACILAAGVVAWLQLGWLEGLLAFGGGFGGTGLLLWLLPRTKAGKQLVLEEVQQGKAADPSLGQLVGVQGVVVTPLRPAGAVRLQGRLVDVVTEGMYVEAGTTVRVRQVEGGRVVVEPV